jgi:uncharacterized protein YukE
MTDENSGGGGGVKESAKMHIDGAKEDLRKLRDELELKAGLAKLEAQKAKEKLEPHMKKMESALDDMGRQLGDVAEKARLQATLAASEAKAQWPGFEAAVDHMLTDIKSELKKSADAIDADKTASEVTEKLNALKKRLFG